MLAKNPDGMTLPEISKTSGYSRSSIFRILCTLEDCGYVVKKEDERTFRMSRKLAALGYAAFGESNIVEKGMDILRQMRDRLGETSMLGTMLDEGCVMIEQAPGTYPFKFLGEIGMRIPFHASAPGKAMLAFLPDSEAERKISKEYIWIYGAHKKREPRRRRQNSQRICRRNFGQARLRASLKLRHCAAFCIVARRRNGRLFARCAYTAVSAIQSTGGLKQIRRAIFPAWHSLTGLLLLGCLLMARCAQAAPECANTQCFPRIIINALIANCRVRAFIWPPPQAVGRACLRYFYDGCVVVAR